MMIDPRDEQWLKRVLCDCFGENANNISRDRDLRGFRILLEHLIKNIEEKIGETHFLWNLEPDSKELQDRFCSLEKSLFFLRRFCQPR